MIMKTIFIIIILVLKLFIFSTSTAFYDATPTIFFIFKVKNYMIIFFNNIKYYLYLFKNKIIEYSIIKIYHFDIKKSYIKKEQPLNSEPQIDVTDELIIR